MEMINMSISFYPTNKYSKLKAFLQTECSDYFSSVEEVNTGASSGITKQLKCFGSSNQLFLMLGIYDDSDLCVLESLDIYSESGDDTKSILSTTQQYNKLMYYSKCKYGVFVCFGSSNLITSNPSGYMSTILITKNNNDTTTLIIPKFQTSGTFSKSTALSDGLYCVAETDLFDTIRAFSYNRLQLEQWQAISFVTSGDGYNTSYTPFAHYLQYIEYGYDTSFGRITDSDGYTYMTNGYWVVRD
jgi:hypothetical protein